jgi:hypothetical protein
MIQLYESSMPIHGPSCILLIGDKFIFPNYDTKSTRIVGL